MGKDGDERVWCRTHAWARAPESVVGGDYSWYLARLGIRNVAKSIRLGRRIGESDVSAYTRWKMDDGECEDPLSCCERNIRSVHATCLDMYAQSYNTTNQRQSTNIDRHPPNSLLISHVPPQASLGLTLLIADAMLPLPIQDCKTNTT